MLKQVQHDVLADIGGLWCKNRAYALDFHPPKQHWRASVNRAADLLRSF